MGLFDTWSWDLLYGDLKQKNTGEGSKIKTRTNPEQSNLAGSNNQSNALTPGEELIKGNANNSATVTRKAGDLSGDLAADEFKETSGELSGLRKSEVVGSSHQSSKEKSRDESKKSGVNFTEATSSKTINKKGFYQDDEAKLQDLRRNSAARQATNSIITMLTGSNAGVLPDQAAAYLQERNAVVDKYNSQMALNNISGTTTAGNINLDEQYALSERSSTSTGGSIQRAGETGDNYNGVRVGVGIKEDPKIPGTIWTPDASGSGGSIQVVDDTKVPWTQLGKYGVGGDALKKGVADKQAAKQGG